MFNALLKIPRHKEELANNPHVIKQLNSLWSLLSRKVDTERKYINKLEGVPLSQARVRWCCVLADKASDKSAKRATEKAFIASNQLVELGNLFETLAVEPNDFAKYVLQARSSPQDAKASKKKKSKSFTETNCEDWRFEATQWKPKNMLAKEKLTQLRTTGLPREASVGTAAKPTYVPPSIARRLRVLSTDMDAEQLERRTNIRLMSDYKHKPKTRSGSIALEAAPAGKKGAKSQKASKRSASLVPESKIPRMARSAMKDRQGRL